MAKKRKTTRRRSRVSGLNTKQAGGLLMQSALGAVGAIIIKKIADQLLPAEYAAQSNYAIAAAGLGLALLVKNPSAAAAGAGAVTVSLYNIGQDLADGQSVTGLGLLRPGVPSFRIGEPFNDPAGMKVNYV